MIIKKLISMDIVALECLEETKKEILDDAMSDLAVARVNLEKAEKAYKRESKDYIELKVVLDVRKGEATK